MGNVDTVPDRAALAGAIIAVMFGVAWTEWAASGMSGAGSGAIRVFGLVVGLVILFGCARRWRTTPRASSSASSAPPREASRSMFSSPSYLLIVGLEFAAIGGVGKLLSTAGHSDYVITWAATVVGLHFLAFGRLFVAGFYGWGRH